MYVLKIIYSLMFLIEGGNMLNKIWIYLFFLNLSVYICIYDHSILLGYDLFNINYIRVI